MIARDGPALVAIPVGKRPQMLPGLGLFTLATATLLTMLALNDQPFQGFAAVSDSPLHKVLADFPARPPAPVIARPD